MGSKTFAEMCVINQEKIVGMSIFSCIILTCIVEDNAVNAVCSVDVVVLPLFDD